MFEAMKEIRDIYLDANATTPVLPQAAQAALETMEDSFGNPSSSHIAGLRARKILNGARASALRMLGAEGGRVVFTSGATEAIQTAVLSAMCDVRERSSDSPSGPRYCLYGATEHKAVPQSLHHWCQILGMPHEIVEIPVDAEGRLDLEFLAKFAGEADLICTMAVNNETGVIQDLKAVEKTIRSANPETLWMVDAVQAVGKIDLRFEDLSIDYAAVSGHKLYAPKGIGLLYLRDGSPFKPLMAGGGQESGARGGTENLPGVAAIQAVMEFMEQGGFHSHETMLGFRDRIVTSLQKAFPEICFNTPFDSAVPTTINFAVLGLESKELLDLFDAADIRVSSGSACGSGATGSFVLEAMGLPKWRTDGAIRLSFGPMITQSEVTTACMRIKEAGKAMARSCLVARRDEIDAAEKVDGLIQLKKGSMCSWIYLDAASSKAIIVDPFEELSGRIEAIVRCQNCRIAAILDTHMHVDHDSCRDQLMERLSDDLAPEAHTEDPLGWPAAEGEVEVGNGDTAPFISLGERWSIARVELPGHTVVGCAYLLGEAQYGKLAPEKVRFAFTGDTILLGGIGRTDFDSSSMSSLYHSVRSLSTLLGRTSVICPTHDYHNGFATTLETERRENSFLNHLLCEMAPMTFDEFAERKPKLDDGIDDESSCELICGNIAPPSKYEAALDIPLDERADFFRKHKDSFVIDVREPHEFEFARDWDELGLESPPINVPLTRFAGYLQTLLSENANLSELEIVCLCRSGNRSSRAAETLQRCGIRKAWNLIGGLALNQSSYQEITELEYAI
jgi:cysteine sulfinate desulfinase/cysteine desulfurase-like protein/glyoxylase-like metal-dependent hydrolase (beta-lactamase superfamily II)/rhodanese-related sulfurtransferase